MMRKNIYKWHRVSSLIIAIPVLLWAFSGFMHPIMTNFRPAVSTQAIPVEALNKHKIPLSLQEVLARNKLDSVYSVRLIHIDTNWFYQLRLNAGVQLTYISAKNGQILPKGDWLYAQYLARFFLEGPLSKDVSHRQDTLVRPVAPSMAMDCCGEAAATVLHHKRGAPIAGVSAVHTFNNEYKSIYCLLPVYKVAFDRVDRIRLYVETGQDRFAVAFDKNRAAFNAFFSLVHTWGWINFLGKGRVLVEMFFCGLAFLTALMGIYIFCTTRSKKVQGNKLVKARRNHRYTAIVASIFTLMFCFSGGYHAFSGLKGEEKTVYRSNHAFAASAVTFDLDQLQDVVQKPISNIGLVQIDGQSYWQVYVAANQESAKTKDLMAEMGTDAAEVVYVRMHDYAILPNGDEKYAQELATAFSGKNQQAIVSCAPITRFTDEYNFTDKRLPVWKVSYSDNHRERLYIETSTGVLAKRTNDLEVYEGYSFALLHKHHYMDFFGKTVRDISTMVGAGLQVLMIAVGLILYVRWRNRRASSVGKR
ncbi:PepSY domain-containing protein [Olivibacter ginsenosidimutans]|uniref:PepSY domain-containing protein n=1 Tax=Olivibacter ginsenosidimutans TaxID=1176537 RepID=A0ABP9C8Q4_9SPHI